MQVFGYWGRYPEVREQPFVVAPVTDKDATQDEFDIAVDRGTATAVPDVEYEPDSCFYLDVGNGGPEFVSYPQAAGRIATFADEKIAKGDRLFRAGNEGLALAFYGIAAAVAQHPQGFARMLLCPMREARKIRIELALAQVADLDPPSLHVDNAREEMGIQ